MVKVSRHEIERRFKRRHSVTKVQGGYMIKRVPCYSEQRTSATKLAPAVYRVYDRAGNYLDARLTKEKAIKYAASQYKTRQACLNLSMKGL